jgi:hypothetical protein
MALTLNNKIKGLKIGDYFWCKYIAPSGSIGTFSDIAKRTDNEATSAELSKSNPTSTPNGYFKFIVVDIKNGKTICVADRLIQSALSWDNINNDGYAFGRQIKIDNNNESNIKYTMKIPSGGIANTDTNNEWDKYIVNSTLNGNVVAGDNAIWNWSGQWTLTTTSPTTPNTSRNVRGNTSVGSHGNVTSSTVSYQYRPILIIEKMYTNKHFLLINGEYRKVVSTSKNVYGDPSSTTATPSMTSNTTPSGIAFASSKFSASYEPYKLFNNIDDTEGWVSVNGTNTGYAGYIFPSPVIIGKYTIRGNATNPSQNPKNFTFEASNDTTNGTDGTWVTLDTQVNQTMTIGNIDWIYSINNNTSYKAYRVNISANNGMAGFCGFNELKLHERPILNSNMYSFQTVGVGLPTKAQFNSDGISDLSILDRRISAIPSIDMGTSNTLGSGKQFSKKIDLKRYFDIRKIEIK